MPSGRLGLVADVADVDGGDGHQHADDDRVLDEAEDDAAGGADGGRPRRGARKIGVESLEPARHSDRGEEANDENEGEDRIGH